MHYDNWIVTTLSAALARLQFRTVDCAAPARPCRLRTCHSRPAKSLLLLQKRSKAPPQMLVDNFVSNPVVPGTATA